MTMPTGQTAAQPDVQISPAFARPPSTAAMFAQQYAQSEAGQYAAQQNAQPQQPTQPQGQPQPQPQGQPQNAQPANNQIIVPPARRVNPILPPQRTSQQQAPTQPQVAPPPSATPGQPESTPSKPVPSPAPTFSSEAALQRQLEQERQAWAAEREQWRNAIQQQNEMLQQAGTMQQEYNVLKQQAELNQKLSSDELFANLATVGADDARQLVQLTAQTLQGPLDTMRQEMQKQQAALIKQQEYINSQMVRMQQQKAVQDLYAAHPDFGQLAYDPGFTQFAQQRDGYTSRTREQTAWEEFNRGNSEYIIQMINEYKGVAPKTENVQVVPPVQVANGAAQPTPQGPTAPRFTLAELNNLMQMRQITPEQYREYLNEYRQAQSMQPPQ